MTLPIFVTYIFKMLCPTLERRIIYQNIKSPEGIQCFVHKRLTLSSLPNIPRQKKAAPSLSFDLPCNLLRILTLRIKVRHGNIGAFPGKSQSHSTPDSGIPSRNQSHLPRQFS